MPILSCFTSMGTFRLSGQVSLGEAIYNGLRGSEEGSGYGEGGHRDATRVAQAMGMARACASLERAQNQLLPSKVEEMLSAKEVEYGLVPAPTDTRDQRRSALSARYLLTGGATRQSIVAALQTVLGSAYVDYRTFSSTNPSTTPAYFPLLPGNGPGNFQLPSVARKTLRLTAPLFPSLVPIAVPAVRADPLDVGSVLAVGDVVVVDPDNGSMAEKCTLVAYTIDPHDKTPKISVTKAHATGALIITQPWPYWISNSRYDLVVLTDAAAADAETRRKVNALLAELLRGVTQWGIASASYLTGFYSDSSPTDRTVAT